MLNFIKVDITENFYRFRVRPPQQFVDFAVPEWARRVAESVVEGAQVVMGMTEAETWLPQSVMVPIEVGDEFVAEDIAQMILDDFPT